MQQSSASSANNQEQHLRAQLELLQKHEAGAEPSLASLAASPPESKAAPSQPAESRASNGYDRSIASPDAPRTPNTKTEADSHIHPDLRGQYHSPDTKMMSMGSPPQHSPGPPQAGPSNPALAPAPSPPAHDDDDSNEGRKANKRELSQSKRAAQNRAAQRAFRQRKEGYIKKLEQQVREYIDMEQSFKSMQSENYALREYVLHLQSRLSELGLEGDFPAPPPNINLSSAASQAPQQPAATTQEPLPSNPGAGTPLEAVAQAVAGLAAQEQMAERQLPFPNSTFKTERGDEDTRTADEINRQLQSEEGSGPSSAV